MFAHRRFVLLSVILAGVLLAWITISAAGSDGRRDAAADEPGLKVGFSLLSTIAVMIQTYGMTCRWSSQQRILQN